MMASRINGSNTEFVILCFEGPDGYSNAGGLGVRISHLSAALARTGFSTHLFFIGDPRLAGEERRCGGKLILHRWCQWISSYHPNGVYDGEEGKVYDFNESIPRFVISNVVRPAIQGGKLVVVLAEEWQTAEALCRLHDRLGDLRLRDRAVMFWNANNTFSFHRIDWLRLSSCATITAVSRYMKHLMWPMGINPVVISNGIPKKLLRRVNDTEAAEVRGLLGADLVLSKVARWDPHKGWDAAIEAVSHLKDRNLKVRLLARGGIEPYGEEMIHKAYRLGLKVAQAETQARSGDGCIQALREASTADVINIRFPLSPELLRLIYRASDVVLANSGHEPFGLVGLEAMAAGGIAFTGNTGEDYTIPMVNSIVLETGDPMEIVGHIVYLRENPEEGEKIRDAARRTARYFTWQASVRSLIGRLESWGQRQGWLPGRLVGEKIGNGYAQLKRAG
jgi:glycosyltransferase involved in cell wall biosynthesis